MYFRSIFIAELWVCPFQTAAYCIHASLDIRAAHWSPLVTTGKQCLAVLTSAYQWCFHIFPQHFCQQCLALLTSGGPRSTRGSWGWMYTRHLRSEFRIPFRIFSGVSLIFLDTFLMFWNVLRTAGDGDSAMFLPNKGVQASQDRCVPGC